MTYCGLLHIMTANTDQWVSEAWLAVSEVAVIPGDSWSEEWGVRHRAGAALVAPQTLKPSLLTPHSAAETYSAPLGRIQPYSTLPRAISTSTLHSSAPTFPYPFPILMTLCFSTTMALDCKASNYWLYFNGLLINFLKILTTHFLWYISCFWNGFS